MAASIGFPTPPSSPRPRRGCAVRPRRAQSRTRGWRICAATERGELPGELRQTVRQARGAQELREGLGDLRRKDRNLRLERVGAQDPAAVVRTDARRRRREWRRLGRLGLSLRIGHRPFDQPSAVGAHAAEIDLRLGDASRRLPDTGVGAVAGDPLCEGFDVARQSGIEPDRHVEPVTKRVLRRLSLAGRRLRTGAGARIGAVRPNSTGARHAPPRLRSNWAGLP
jgi:hypothetical protein